MKKTLVSAAVYLLPFVGWAEDISSGKLLSGWIGVHLKLVRTTQGVAHIAYCRHFSYTSIAFYESVVAGDKQ